MVYRRGSLFLIPSHIVSGTESKAGHFETALESDSRFCQAAVFESSGYAKAHGIQLYRLYTYITDLRHVMCRPHELPLSLNTLNTAASG